MAEQSRLFLGLVRPPKLLGLPIMYAMVWLFGSVLIFVWLQHWQSRLSRRLPIPCCGRRRIGDENFLDVVVTALQVTRPTLNRKIHGGDSYAP